MGEMGNVNYDIFINFNVILNYFIIIFFYIDIARYDCYYGLYICGENATCSANGDFGQCTCRQHFVGNGISCIRKPLYIPIFLFFILKSFYY